jgi:urease accessory protein UreF
MTSLALLQLVSPALPVGAFSYSEGLEVLIQNGALNNEFELQHWIEAELQRGALRLEAAALKPLRALFQGWEDEGLEMPCDLISLDGWLLALRESASADGRFFAGVDGRSWTSIASGIASAGGLGLACILGLGLLVVEDF